MHPARRSVSRVDLFLLIPRVCSAFVHSALIFTVNFIKPKNLHKRTHMTQTETPLCVNGSDRRVTAFVFHLLNVGASWIQDSPRKKQDSKAPVLGTCCSTAPGQRLKGTRKTPAGESGYVSPSVLPDLSLHVENRLFRVPHENCTKSPTVERVSRTEKGNSYVEEKF